MMRTRPWTSKVPVMVLVSRDSGEARAFPIGRVTAENLDTALRQHVHPSAKLYTDELLQYQGPGKRFEGGHETVHHSLREYLRGDVNINSAESYNALLKRGIHGAFHHVSVKHLGRYCDEFSFRWTNRKVTDGERTKRAIEGAEGKRLTYYAVKGEPKLTT